MQIHLHAERLISLLRHSKSGVPAQVLADQAGRHHFENKERTNTISYFRLKNPKQKPEQRSS